MKNKELTVSIKWNEHGCPVVDLPDGAFIALSVTRGTEGSSQNHQTLNEVELTGNSLGLKVLALYLLSLSEVESPEHHLHFDKEVFPNFFKSSADWWLTITKVTKKRKT